MGKVEISLSICVAALSAVGALWADAPVEEFLSPDELHPDLLSRTVAVLSVSMPVDEQAARRSLGNDPAGRDVDFRHLPAQQPITGGFSDVVPLPLAETRPVSQSSFTFTWVRRFPVLDQRGDFVELVIDPRSLATVWVDRAGWTERFAALEPWAGFHWLPLREDRTWVGDDRRGVSLFALESHELRLFQEPDRHSAAVLVDRSSPIPWLDEPQTFGELEGTFVLEEIRGGLGHLIQVDACGEMEDRHLGWIPIFDTSGRLAIWPEVSLSC